MLIQSKASIMLLFSMHIIDVKNHPNIDNVVVVVNNDDQQDVLS